MVGWYTGAENWLDAHMLACPVKNILHIDCPGCGLQRSWVALLRFDFAASWRVYPPGMFMAALLLFLVAHLIFNFRSGAFILKLLYIASASAVVINYIYKIATHHLY
jgi:hypothetical protein